MSATDPSGSENGGKNESKERTTWENLNIEKNILDDPAMANLQTSYDILEPELKCCLLYFSIFPENSIIKVRSLIYWWIGEEIVISKDGKTAEEMGKMYCKQLMDMGMIKPESKGSIPTLDSCTIHPWIQCMVRTVATSAGFPDLDDHTGRLVAQLTSSRRGFLVGNGKVLSGMPENVVTLFNVDAKTLRFEPEWLTRLKKIEVLQLGKWNSSEELFIDVNKTDFLTGLKVQKHLKYLSLQGISRIYELPESLCNLTSVRILDLRGCSDLKKLPSGITSMKKLTHLDVSKCYYLEYMPKGFQSLTELEVLKGFLINDTKRKGSSRLSELAELKKLCKLSIRVANKSTLEETELGKLNQLGTLHILKIRWGKPKPIGSGGQPAIASLPVQPVVPQELEKLELDGFPGSEEPGWLIPSVLNKLKRLYILRGELASLCTKKNPGWKVEVLRFKGLKNLSIEWLELLEAFPNCCEVFSSGGCVAKNDLLKDLNLNYKLTICTVVGRGRHTIKRHHMLTSMGAFSI